MGTVFGWRTMDGKEISRVERLGPGTLLPKPDLRRSNGIRVDPSLRHYTNKAANHHASLERTRFESTHMARQSTIANECSS